MNLEKARLVMVQQQVSPWQVSSAPLLEALNSIPRERFSPPTFQQLCFSEASVPLAYQQTMLAPALIARLLQALSPDQRETALLVGTGAGYSSAVLSKLVKKVVSVEHISGLSQQAAQNCEALKLNNINFKIGDGVHGWPTAAPFDAILLTGSLPFLPSLLRDQLAIGGRLVAVLGKAPAMQVVLVTRQGKDRWNEQVLFETVIPPLCHKLRSAYFSFE
jgi:protein-L-isoaspartate(D-aspartate) O-methyltransferase